LISAQIEKRGLPMFYTPDLVHELNTLIRFDLATSQQGIKVHKTADPEVIAAVGRLYSKGLLTQVDGGYLTGLGRDAAEHAQLVLTILTPSASASPRPDAGIVAVSQPNCA
jgi:uncharacterized protein (TIGR02647 family)